MISHFVSQCWHGLLTSNFLYAQCWSYFLCLCFILPFFFFFFFFFCSVDIVWCHRQSFFHLCMWHHDIVSIFLCIPMWNKCLNNNMNASGLLPFFFLRPSLGRTKTNITNSLLGKGFSCVSKYQNMFLILSPDQSLLCSMWIVHVSVFVTYIFFFYPVDALVFNIVKLCAMITSPEGRLGMSDVSPSPCLESQGCHLIPL